MTLEEVKKEEKKLYEELERLEEIKVKLEQEKYKKYIGKFYRFNMESIYNGYIYLEDLWGAPNYVLEGMWFNPCVTESKRYNCFHQEGYRQFHIRNQVKGWNDFHLTEISKEEFIREYTRAMDAQKKIFINFTNDSLVTN